MPGTVGAATSESLARTRFVVLGVGGLGCPALVGLVMGGARRLTLVDHDVVEVHNLQRQVLFGIADVGSAKVDAAAFSLRGRAPRLEIETQRRRLSAADIDTLVAVLADGGEPAVVLECTDAPALKFALSDAAVAHGTRAVVSAALGWRGQAIAVRPGAACYRCVYEDPPPAETVPTCAQAGVIGAGVGLLGFLAAGLALKLALGDEDPAAGLHDVDLLTAETRVVSRGVRPGCPAHAAAPRYAHRSATPNPGGA